MILSAQIINWYKKNKRDLPFRNTDDAYKIWLSEIILQQTRVEQGLPYYYKFIEAFPDVFLLAEANEKTVLKLWQGLGYYSRGRNLHETAKTICKNYQGKFPCDYALLLQLKGVGEYTAAAIASFAFGLAHAVVDGNVVRVISRVFGIDAVANSTAGKKIFLRTAQEILDTKNPALHNYALMELGALVCKPQNPQCNVCPLVEICHAFKYKKQNAFPVKEKKATATKRYLYYLVIQHKKKLLIKQRTGKDIWKNLYDFPLIETSQKRTVKKIIASNEFREIVEQKKIRIENVSHEFTHKLSHQTIYAVFIKIAMEKEIGVFENRAYKYVSVTDLKKKYALPRLIDLYLQTI